MGVRLIYDGDCGLCRYTVDYARSVTLNRVDYCPYQSVEDEYPDIDASEFAASIYLIDGESRHMGAAAAFETLAIGGLGLWRWLYRRLPGFAPLSEKLYRWV